MSGANAEGRYRVAPCYVARLMLGIANSLCIYMLNEALIWREPAISLIIGH